MTSVITWTEIEAFHSIRKYTQAHPEILNGNSIVKYRAKVKLHGANCAIQIRPNEPIVCQSRTAILTPERDFAGFAEWVKQSSLSVDFSDQAKSRTKYDESQWQNLASGQGLILFGEWVGKGIQKGVAVSSIPNKSFAIFGARYFDNDLAFVMEPAELEGLLERGAIAETCVLNFADTYVLPWHDLTVEIDWSASDADLAPIAETISKAVLEVEKNDPWVKSVFNIDGVGEGLVFYPVSKEHLGYDNFKNLVFKAKGKAHKVIASAKPAQVNPETASSINAFVEMVLTPARLDQGAQACAPIEPKNTGKFVAWVQSDVSKECQLELQASGISIDDVKKALTIKAREYFLNKTKG